MHNKSILNSLADIKKIDTSNVLGSIEALADQVEHAWEATQNLTFTPKTEIRNVVVAGMGGSALGADLIQHIFKLELSVPFAVVNSYDLPGYVDQHSLVVLSSYSGTTEEILSCAKDAQKRQAQIMVISAGGDLEKLAKKNKYTHYLIDPKYNPSNQPRMAIGYSVFGSVALLSKAGIVPLKKSMVDAVIATIRETQRSCGVAVVDAKNVAKQLAWQMHNLRAVLVGADFMAGPLHVSTNQFNENAKAYADYKVVPEINHHLLEGLRFPETNDNTHVFVFVNSSLYSQRLQKRMELTKQIVEKQGIPTTSVELRAKDKLTQAFESITIFAYTNFYLAMLEGIDPAPIPTVDWFKEQLGHPH